MGGKIGERCTLKICQFANDRREVRLVRGVLLKLVCGWSPKQVGDGKLKPLPHTLNIMELCDINHSPSVFKLSIMIVL